VVQPLKSLEAGYEGEETPLAGYAGLIATFTALGGGVLAVAERSGRLPDRLRVSDLVLASMATQHLARLVAKDRVTSVFRAPLTRYQRRGRPGEVDEEPRRTGPALALGQMIVCPFCLGQWIALGFISGFLFAPRATRAAASVLTVSATADLLQEAYVRFVPEDH
jgi:Protein of unknown function (DUF1360)